MAFCTACGANVSEGDAFCQKCGAGMQGSAVAVASTEFVPPTPIAQPVGVAGANAACPNCGNFKRESKSTLSTIGKGVIVLGLLPGVIGAYQYLSFDNKNVLERAAYQVMGADPRADAAMTIGLGVLVMVIGLVMALGGNLGGIKACTNCGYKFKRGE